MVVRLYKMTGNNNSLSKSLELKHQSDITITPTMGISLLGGELTLDYNDTVDWSEINYIYISDFKRYYFVKNITLSMGKVVILNTQVDPLYTFADSIRAASGTCLRSESFGSPTYYPDSKYPVYPERTEAHSTVFDISAFDVTAEYSYIVGVLSKSGGE